MEEEKADVASLSPEERQGIIVERVNGAGRVLAAALAQEFGVSEDSIRRDLRDLAEAGLVQRFHGGASRLVTPVVDFRRRETIDTGEKERIGKAAATLIPEGATLLVDSSTTVVHFIRNLPKAMPLRIITTAVDAAAAALDLPLAEVVLLGGRLNKLTRSATGARAIEAIRGLRADFCILGTCGIDNDLLLRADDIEDAHLKATMIKASNTTILLTPSNKLGRLATYEVAPISVASSVFTSAQTTLTKRIKELGVDVEIV